MTRNGKIGPWEDFSEELRDEIAQAFAQLPAGFARSHGEAIETVRNASIAWLERKNRETGHEHLVVHEMTTNDANGTVIAGTNHHPRLVRPDPKTWAWMTNPHHLCEIWHNHPDIGEDQGSAWLSTNDIAALGCPGVRVVAALNAAGERCAVRVRSHKNLTAGKMLTWLTLVDDTAKKVMEKHQRAGTVWEIERAEAVTWAGSEAGLYTIVLEPSTLRRGDIVSEILAHPDVVKAPPAQEQKETPYAGPDRTTQTSVGTTHDAARAPGIAW